MSNQNDNALNVLLSHIMKNRYCREQGNDFDACVANYVPQGGDGSYVEQYLVRRGSQVCQPYLDVFQECMQDDRKHRRLMKQASTMPECSIERKAWTACEQKNASASSSYSLRGGKGGDSVSSACDTEAREMLMCGLAHIVQKMKGHSTNTNGTNTAHNHTVSK